MRWQLWFSTSLLLGLLSAQSFSESAQDLLEEGIYQEETVGDLAAANKLYRKIIKDTQKHRPIVARALYRLGVNHKQLGHKEKALEALKKLTAEYPKQQQLVIKAQQLIHEMGRESLVLSTVPWVDGEIAQYSVFSPAKGYIGGSTYAISKGELEGSDVWTIDNHTVVPLSQHNFYGRTIVDSRGFLPVKGEIKSTILNDMEYLFQEDKLTINLTEKGKENSNDIEALGDVYDGNQLFHLVRRVELDEEFSRTLSVFDVNHSKIFTITMDVVGRKKVSVKAGTFDCYELELSYLGDKRELIRKDKMLVADDPSRHIVRYINKDFSMDLEKVRGNLYANSERHQYKDLNLSFVTPGAWNIIDIAYAQPGLELFLSISGTKFKPDAMFAVAKIPGNHAVPPAKVVEGDVNVLKSYFKDYTLREGSVEDVTVSTIPARRFIADYEYQGKAMVEYRIYIVGNGKVYWFILRAEKNQFEAAKKPFEDLYNSLEAA